MKVLVGTGVGHELPLDGCPFTIGRVAKCNLSIEGDDVSRVHCTISFRPDSLWAEDNGSRNGTFVSGKRLVKPVPLPPGVDLRLGNSFRCQVLVGAAQTGPPLSTAKPGADRINTVEIEEFEID